jgi:hypothetical protein
VEAADILELMAAANFFQLDGLLHYCEYRCADLIDLDTIVSYYIHAKVGLLNRLEKTGKLRVNGQSVFNSSSLDKNDLNIL